MPNLNAKAPGDNFYPKYAVHRDAPVSAIAITKGRLYTKGGAEADGDQLVAVTETGFVNGIYQATETIAVAGTAGEHTMQCQIQRSRVCLVASADNMHAGQVVQYNIATHKVEVWTGTAGGITPNELHIICGRIYRIYSKENIEVEKELTAADDYVIVDLGGVF